MNAADLREKLLGQGIPAMLVDSMIKTAQKHEEREAKAREPKAKKKGRWFPGMDDGKTGKVEADVEVTSVCQTCGDVDVRTIKMTIKADSPRTQKVAVSLCNHCPEFLRTMEHDVLVSLILLKQHPATGTDATHKTQVKMANRMKPEEVVTLVLHK